MYSGSLVDLCLETIVDNFPRYNSVFNTTKDDSMKRRFEFLQRKYSFEILSRLSTKGGSLEEYVDLLINKYLKVLDTSWLRNCSWEKVTSKIAEIGCNIEKLSSYKECITEETPWQEKIDSFPNLKCFIFRASSMFQGIIDLILKHLAIFCPNIEEIELGGFLTISSEAVKYLCKNENGEALCTKLKILHIEETFIKEDDMKYLLQSLPSLEIIDYRNLPLVLYSLHKNDLSSLDNVKPYRIVELNLSHFVNHLFFLDIRKVCLSLCPHLKFLTYGLLENNDLNVLPKLLNLQKLCIDNVSDSKTNIDELLKAICGKLTVLTVTNCTLSVSVLAESYPNLTVLELNKVNLLVDCNSKCIRNLSSFRFEDSDSDISMNTNAIGLLLSSSEKLKSLTFQYCNLLPSEIKATILKCCELYPVEEISFLECVIEIDFIKELLLLSCHTLTSIDVSGCLNRSEEEMLLKFADTLPSSVAVLSDCPKDYFDKIRIYIHIFDDDDDDDANSVDDFYFGFPDDDVV